MFRDGKPGLLPIAILMIIVAVLSSVITRQMMPSGSGMDQAALEKALSDFVVKNPELIGKAVEEAYAMQQKKEEEEATKNLAAKMDELRNDPGSPVVGNKDGSKVLIEFFDYNCGYCKKMLPDLNALLAEDKDLKIVLKEIPILGDMSHLASKISLAVYKNNPDKYWQFHNDLLTHGARSEEQILSLATNLGIDTEKLKQDYNSETINKQLDKHVELASSIGIRGTPAFIAGNTMIRGAQGKEAIIQGFKNPQ